MSSNREDREKFDFKEFWDKLRSSKLNNSERGTPRWATLKEHVGQQPEEDDAHEQLQD